MPDQPQGPTPPSAPTPPQQVDLSNTEHVEEVPSSVILQEAGHAEEGTFTQRAGMKLAKWVGTLAALITIAIVGRWIWMSWCYSCPNLSSLTPEQASTAISNYKAVQEQAVQSAKDMFDAVVVKVLLPVFTSILGYIFGARAASEGHNDDEGKAS